MPASISSSPVGSLSPPCPRRQPLFLPHPCGLRRSDDHLSLPHLLRPNLRWSTDHLSYASWPATSPPPVDHPDFRLPVPLHLPIAPRRPPTIAPMSLCQPHPRTRVTIDGKKLRGATIFWLPLRQNARESTVYGWFATGAILKLCLVALPAFSRMEWSGTKGTLIV
jgi:hypothetical protein